MLSQVEVLAPRPQAVTPAALETIQVPVAVQVSSTDGVTFSVPPGLGVEVDKEDPRKLIVHPGSYFLDFILEEDAFKNPAILVLTDFGAAGVMPSGEQTATMFNANILRKGDPDQILELQLNLASGPHDPTIVNTPDPA
jgi:hypothetical protein